MVSGCQDVPGNHGTLAPWYFGTMVPWHNGTNPSMVAWCQDTMAPRCHGSTALWYHDTLVPGRHGAMALVMVSWCHGGMARRYHGSWCQGVMVPWDHRIMVQGCSWYNGTAIPRYHCNIVPWYHGAMVPWCHGGIVPWWHGGMVRWCHATLVPSQHGTMEPWHHGTIMLGCLSAGWLSAQRPHTPGEQRVRREGWSVPALENIFPHVGGWVGLALPWFEI